METCGVCKFGSGLLQEASRGALSRWLKDASDTDIAEKTRCSVLEAQEANGNIHIAEQLKLFKESSGEPVSGHSSPPGMLCACEQNVRKHTVCNVHTLHCSEYLPMLVSPFKLGSLRFRPFN